MNEYCGCYVRSSSVGSVMGWNPASRSCGFKFRQPQKFWSRLNVLPNHVVRLVLLNTSLGYSFLRFYLRSLKVLFPKSHPDFRQHLSISNRWSGLPGHNKEERNSRCVSFSCVSVGLSRIFLLTLPLNKWSGSRAVPPAHILQRNEQVSFRLLDCYRCISRRSASAYSSAQQRYSILGH